MCKYPSFLTSPEEGLMSHTSTYCWESWLLGGACQMLPLTVCRSLLFHGFKQTQQISWFLLTAVNCLQYLPAADTVVVMADGQITHMGTFDELTAKG
jgi:ABC-type branched-subunit amino acid transport system ATPase component